ncbi:unnamed protein product [Thlaspi arvense]|uniref:F-box domain-containing protein n=1 Tax=Thlaspi arvense TaxID=13288 RepID=A0AAU9T6L4_THLAR|nr:unnamed protein product [Thlaspi arvense]
MKMEEKHNSKSRKRLGRRREDTLSSWSDLPLDLVNLVLERLGFADFQRAKSVCSSWYSASRQRLSKNNHIPWLILFPKENNYLLWSKKGKKNYDTCCRLFYPKEKDKLYRTKDLGLEFSRSVCMKTYGSWLLMRDPLNNLYIVNLSTQERINLPPTESQLGKTKMERTRWCVAADMRKKDIVDGVWFRIDGHEYKGISITCPLFWIDEKTKDHVVIWGLASKCVVYSKKGDTSWTQIPKTSGCCNMVYNDHKLYFLSNSNRFKIFDFSGEIPRQTFQRGYNKDEYPRIGPIISTKLVVTVRGEVLKVVKKQKRGCGCFSTCWSFRVSKVFSSGFLKKHELVHSLGDESLLWDQGITVLANDTGGFIRNSIYFSDCNGINNIFLYNLETEKTEQLHTFGSSSVQYSRARWFLPSFRHT